MRFHVPAGRFDQAGWLIHGPFAKTRFPIRPAALQEERDSSSGKGKRYRFQPEGEPATFLAPRGAYLLASRARDRITTDLRQADSEKVPPVHGPVMRRLLGQVDRKQTVWLAAVPPQMGPGVARLTADRDAPILRDVLRYCSAVHGGIQCDQDMRLHFILEGEDEVGIGIIQKRLEVQKGFARIWLAGNRQAPRDQRLWYALLARTQLSLRGTTLEISSHVQAADLD
jgi:hypothetical protein